MTNSQDRQQPPLARLLRVPVTDMIFLSGQVSRNDDGSIYAPGNLVKQSERILENIAGLLAEEGANLTNVVKLVTYFAVPLDREVAEKYWKVRRDFFGDHRPASTGVEVASLLDPDLLLEIDVVAVL